MLGRKWMTLDWDFLSWTSYFFSSYLLSNRIKMSAQLNMYSVSSCFDALLTCDVLVSLIWNWYKILEISKFIFLNSYNWNLNFIEIISKLKLYGIKIKCYVLSILFEIKWKNKIREIFCLSSNYIYIIYFALLHDLPPQMVYNIK